MDKKKNERNCLDKTINYIPYTTKGPKEALKILDGTIVEGERPDFIIENSYGCIGVEHFLVDTLIEGKNTSRTRAKQGESKFLSNKYCDNLDGNEENAVKDVERIVQAEINAIQNFDYIKFMSEFKRISEEHIKNAEEYRKNHNLDKCIFLIELHIAKNKILAFDFDSKCKSIKGRKFPFTIEMIAILKKISCYVDFIIISVMHDNFTKCPYMVYVIDSKDFTKSLESQINEVFERFTYDWQTYPFKTKAKLKLEKGKTI